MVEPVDKNERNGRTAFSDDVCTLKAREDDGILLDGHFSLLLTLPDGHHDNLTVGPKGERIGH
jgi:hypothetical protein